jgi:hypothetical protein
MRICTTLYSVYPHAKYMQYIPCWSASSLCSTQLGGEHSCEHTLLPAPHTTRILHLSAYVSTRQHTSAPVSIRQHTSAYVSIRQHTFDCLLHRPLAYRIWTNRIKKRWNRIAGSIGRWPAIYTSSYYYICVHIVLYMCPHSTKKWNQQCTKAWHVYEISMKHAQTLWYQKEPVREPNIRRQHVKIRDNRSLCNMPTAPQRCLSIAISHLNTTTTSLLLSRGVSGEEWYRDQGASWAGDALAAHRGRRGNQDIWPYIAWAKEALQAPPPPAAQAANTTRPPLPPPLHILVPRTLPHPTQ